MQFTIEHHLSFFLHIQLTQRCKQINNLAPNCHVFSLLIVNVDLSLIKQSWEKRFKTALIFYSLYRHVYIYSLLSFWQLCQGDSLLCCLTLMVQALLCRVQTALIQQHAKDLTHHAGVREDNTANTYYWHIDYITSRDEPCHGMYSVSLGNGLEKARVVETVSNNSVCQVATTGMNEELRDSMDLKVPKTCFSTFSWLVCRKSLPTFLLDWKGNPSGNSYVCVYTLCVYWGGWDQINTFL